MRKRHARRQNFCELENFLIRIERVLILAAFGRLDDYLNRIGETS